MKRWLLFVILTLAVAGGVFLILGGKSNAPAPISDGVASEQPAPVDESLPQLIIGDENAPITIIEYGDFQCPICKRFFDQTEPQLISEYIDTGKAKLEFRIETHIGAESVLAGEAAYCAAEQNQFKAMHDALFSRQRGTNSGTFSVSNLKKIAGEIGLGQQEFDTCMDEEQYKAAVIASDEAASKVISGTPTFFIGEHKISGAQPIGVFRAILDQ